MNQIEKNTVSAENQIKNDEMVRFFNGGDELKVMFVGNSITRHGINEDIGWFGDYGMAASSEDKDYAHLIMKKINEKFDASFCMCQASNFETKYENPHNILSVFESARDFMADIIIFRLGDNVSIDKLNPELFKKSFDEFIDFLCQKANTQIVLTSTFWKHPVSEYINEIATSRGCKFVDISDLGEDNSMKAIGLFKHSGVANHPGDKGMETIANRILEKLKI